MACDISAGGGAVTAGSSGIGSDGISVSFSHPHRFERYNYTAPTYCDYCSHLLWGIVKVTETLD
jgi:myotubularin-related protein 5/13